MGLYNPRGEEVHGEFSSADAHSGGNPSFFSQNGKAKTIGAKEVLMITDVNLVSAAGGACSVVATDGGSGVVTLVAGTILAKGVLYRQLVVPFAVPRGWSVVITAPSGQVDCQIEGYLIH